MGSWGFDGFFNSRVGSAIDVTALSRLLWASERLPFFTAPVKFTSPPDACKSLLHNREHSTFRPCHPCVNPISRECPLEQYS